MDNIQLEKAEKHIKTAWIAGTISAALTFIYALAGTYNDGIYGGGHFMIVSKANEISEILKKELVKQ